MARPEGRPGIMWRRYGVQLGTERTSRAHERRKCTTFLWAPFRAAHCWSPCRRVHDTLKGLHLILRYNKNIQLETMWKCKAAHFSSTLQKKKKKSVYPQSDAWKIQWFVSVLIWWWLLGFWNEIVRQWHEGENIQKSWKAVTSPLSSHDQAALMCF